MQDAHVHILSECLDDQDAAHGVRDRSSQLLRGLNTYPPLHAYGLNELSAAADGMRSARSTMDGLIIITLNRKLTGVPLNLRPGALRMEMKLTLAYGLLM
ncbi:hypothetical protein EVG20_g6104 [Dentipellis fragilis]|uniref:Uncharacterized protein n=1 Tax=Dentipellis fragilis TaxID=205917 RepID=A0A4Y9YNH7_9AGAM|nr:hypothetical protein EVG20_g6104 [Dentipellis fragilis]